MGDNIYISQLFTIINIRLSIINTEIVESMFCVALESKYLL
ncbi:hypothetical protein WCLE_009750 [Wolbachia endosymbiont of Cimex lectularius]|nr:hypothetical protein WCLE_009750 [Wolbachia endosymbiont of Cimex lectularius]